MGDEMTKDEMMSLIISNTEDAVIFAVENIQDFVEAMDTFDKEFIIDMLQVIIAKHHDLPEDMDDIRKRYNVKE
jgi:hypothetical protein